jgi:LmbE family N-acetylglucosaminyl deacetylase
MAHPEDALLGAWSVVSALPRSRVVIATRGACERLAAALRTGDAELAFARAGLPRERLECLGFEAMDLVRRLPELREALRERLALAAPAWVITHAFEGGHPDHDATAAAAHLALARVRGAPLLVEVPCAHAADGRALGGRFLDAAPGGEVEVALGPTLRAAKAHALAAHRAPGLDGHVLGCERFRPAPAYAFDRAPLAALYEREGHGSAEELARAAARLLARAEGGGLTHHVIGG